MSAAEIPDAGSRHRRLLGIKLTALVCEHLGRDVDAEVMQFAPGAAMVVEDQAWVLLEERPERRLGAALAWAVRNRARSLHVVADSGTGVLARRGAGFEFPIEVWRAEGRQLVAADPDPVAAPPAARAEHLALVDLIVAGGATPVVEHGVVFGEVRGLEVCRVVDDIHLDIVRLEVGVGAHDREAFQLVHGDVPTVQSLARIVDAVSEYRRLGADQHPLNRIAKERFLRWRLEQDPDRVGAVALVPAEPPVPRANVKDAVPCVARGIASDGAAMTVVCSAGVDLDLAPYAADARLAATRDAGVEPDHQRLVIAVPGRDRLPVLDELTALLDGSAGTVDIVAID